MKVLRIGTLFLTVLFLTGDLCYSQNSQQHYNKAIEYGAAGKFDAAKKEFEDILEDNLYHNTAKVWLERIKETSEGELEKEGVVHFFKGANYYNSGMFNQCIVELKETVRINPNDADAYGSLGVAYRELGMWEKAAVEWRKAITIDPYDIDAHINLGLHYDKKRMFDESILEYKKALELNPDNTEALVNLGAIYNSTGMLDEAVVVLEKAATLDPNDAKAHNNLAIIYYQKKQYGSAIKHCDKAIELGAGVNPEFLEMLKPYRK
ncbi:MAG: tetratricopeptide repeat protein [Candidatus Omnitrophica bacterium]|nr:tetratricopeptide repeat protein [Candidatus Omnitrophota bacterium]MCF7892469.1 tetratricopeptide repeat protein [Candidatus Omnitrophota bacterium]MCF7897588.1 tetratricopeptide repeat protein [Candidatus Omnitrophota bacterium]MCF7909974.1 tetratricopeptide repeat protein [Candidatus Omnitrophota bacterium]